MTRLYQIQEDVGFRAREIASRETGWPCRKGCDDCCRSLASPPQVTEPEWRLIAAALDTLPSQTADAARLRIRGSAGALRPVTCPLLDVDSGTCLVYDARPVACRAYGFYAEREFVLGCSRIEEMGRQYPDVVWGNHGALADQLRSLGPDAPLADWLAAEDDTADPDRLV